MGQTFVCTFSLKSVCVCACEYPSFLYICLLYYILYKKKQSKDTKKYILSFQQRNIVTAHYQHLDFPHCTLRPKPRVIPAALPISPLSASRFARGTLQTSLRTNDYHARVVPTLLTFLKWLVFRLSPCRFKAQSCACFVGSLVRALKM